MLKFLPCHKCQLGVSNDLRFLLDFLIHQIGYTNNPRKQLRLHLLNVNAFEEIKILQEKKWEKSFMGKSMALFTPIPVLQ